MAEDLRAPFPWFGGKSRVADAVWLAFGDVSNYVEPFFGSGAVLLQRPWSASRIETVNDKDGLVANFWRAIKMHPQETAQWADWPVNENDLHARHAWLVSQMVDLPARLEGDPEWCDPKIAGWWVWGICCWIGGGFCSGKGPWQVDADKLVRLGDGGQGINRQLVHLGDGGQGINRKLVHLGDGGRGINRQLVHLGDGGQGINRKLVRLGNDGQGINRKLVHLGNGGQGIKRQLVHLGSGGQGIKRSMTEPLSAWFDALADRLRDVRVCCGDWTRVCGPSPTFKLGLTGVFLDPPYSADAERDGEIYRVEDLSIAHETREWAIELGKRPDMRIALCGYEGEHQMPPGWRAYAWKAHGGYAAGKTGPGSNNKYRERIWFSPACLDPRLQPDLFSEPGEQAAD